MLYVNHCYCCLVAKSCSTFCHPMDCNQAGSPVHGIFPAKILEKVAISSSRRSPQPRDKTHMFCVSCIGRQILHHWATWETVCQLKKKKKRNFRCLNCKVFRWMYAGHQKQLFGSKLNHWLFTLLPFAFLFSSSSIFSFELISEYLQRKLIHLGVYSKILFFYFRDSQLVEETHFELWVGRVSNYIRKSSHLFHTNHYL